MLFKIFRILVLLLIMAALAFYAKTQRLKSRSWSTPLQIVIFPMNPESNPQIEKYIKQLSTDTFNEIDQFFQREAELYSLGLDQPTSTALGPTMQNFPPAAPRPNDNMLKIIWWGLKFRYWAYRNTPDDESNLHRVRVFVYYHQPDKDTHLQHSLGLDKGLLSIVHAFASDEQTLQNNIIIAHEFLHTVGATDKYDAKLQPVFPDGYAEPDKAPLFPQTEAEIMSAKIALSETESKMADSLAQCIIGEKTAEQINWIQTTTDE